jgi:ATP-dependent protease ClpP protease subunit
MDFSNKGNIITAYGNINEGDGIAFVSLFNEVAAKHKKVVIKLHTNGGSVFDGNLMFNAISESPASVEIRVVGIAASMGAVICLATENVYMAENGYMMLHAPSSSAYGTAADLKKSIKILKAIESNFIANLMNKTGQPESYVKQWLEGDNWFSADEALAEGLIKGILKPEVKDIPKATAKPDTAALYSKFSASLLRTQNFKNANMDLLQTLITLLELKQDATEDDVITKVTELAQAQTERQQEQQAEAQAIIQAAVKQGAIVAAQVPHMVKMFAADFAGAKQFIGTLQPYKPITAQIVGRAATANAGNNDTERANWTLDDYRKQAPKELENNPALYRQLVAQARNKN